MTMHWSIVHKSCMSHPVIQALHRSSTAYADKRASMLAPPCAGRVSYISCLSHWNAFIPIFNFMLCVDVYRPEAVFQAPKGR